MRWNIDGGLLEIEGREEVVVVVVVVVVVGGGKLQLCLVAA